MIISDYHFNINLLLQNKILFFEKSQLIIGRINKPSVWKRRPRILKMDLMSLFDSRDESKHKSDLACGVGRAFNKNLVPQAGNPIEPKYAQIFSLPLLGAGTR